MDESKSHCINSDLLGRRVHVAVAGVGGNGAQVVGMLARLNFALLALGHPHGLYVVACDPDTVSEANVGRQIWSPSDVGENKAIVAIERTNLFYGLDWDAEPARYTGDACDMLVSCVDTRGARHSFAKAIQRGAGPRYYWLDMGNEESIGQCCLGEVPHAHDRWTTAGPRLPLAMELFPALNSKAGQHAFLLAADFASVARTVHQRLCCTLRHADSVQAFYEGADRLSRRVPEPRQFPHEPNPGRSGRVGSHGLCGDCGRKDCGVTENGHDWRLDE